MPKRFEKLLDYIKSFFGKTSGLRSRLNDHMQKYSAKMLSLYAAAVCGLMSIIILFVPNYLGMANDSVANEKMGYYKLSYLEEDEPKDGATNEYFVRVYELSNLDRGEEFSLENALVNIAKSLDWVFTRDRQFDIRFLAFIYLLLYLPGVYLILKAALERVQHFSEAVVLAVLGTLIFSDISYVAYFNSLYSDALFFIMLLYIAGCALMLHKDRKTQSVYLIISGIATVGFCLVARRGFLAGIVMAFFYLMNLRYINARRDKALSLAMACLVLSASVLTVFKSNNEFDDIGKYHAMTHGVLLQSTNPSKTLENMGINVSYSVLADDSLYEYYPSTQLANPLVQEFLDNYSGMDIALFYVSHPGALISMWDLGVKASINLRRDYCGNYERRTEMPPMGKSIFWSIWSIFKGQSAPKTIGYLLVLAIIVFVASGRKLFVKRARVERWDFTFFTTCICLLLIGTADITYVIMNSGDAQLVQYNMVLGAVMDIVVYFVIAEMLHKLNLLEDMNSENQA